MVLVERMGKVNVCLSRDEMLGLIFKKRSSSSSIMPYDCCLVMLDESLIHHLTYGVSVRN